MVDAGDVEQDRADEEQAQDPGAGQDQQHAAEDLKGLDHGEIAGAIHLTDEAFRSRRALGRQELEPEVQAEDDERQAEEESGDAGDFFMTRGG